MNRSRRQILIIDDEPYILKSLQRILDDSYNVITALGGQVALDALSQKNLQYDVIICDLSMPDVSGADFYHRISESYPGLEKRIIFMTGGAYTDDLKEFISHVENSCLDKPFEQEELVHAIEKMIST